LVHLTHQGEVFATTEEADESDINLFICLGGTSAIPSDQIRVRFLAYEREFGQENMKDKNPSLGQREEARFLN